MSPTSRRLATADVVSTMRARSAAELSRGEKELKVVRVVLTDSGERVVGLRLPPQVLEPLREQLDEEDGEDQQLQKRGDP